MKKKLSLESIKIKSFVTSLNNLTSAKVIGGGKGEPDESENQCDSAPFCAESNDCTTPATNDTRPAMCPTGPADTNCITNDSKGLLISECC